MPLVMVFSANAASPVRSLIIFALTVVLIGVGVGTNVAVFALVQSLLLSPVDYSDSERLVAVHETWHDTGQRDVRVSPGEFKLMRGSLSAFESAFGYVERRSTLAANGTTRQVRWVSFVGDPFETLGLEFALQAGSPTLLDESERRAVISHRLWKEQWDRGHGLLGSTFRMDGVTHRIIGILRQEGRVAPRLDFDLWVENRSLAMSLSQNLTWHPLHVVARLQPDMSLDGAQAICSKIVRLAHKNDPARTASVSRLHDDVFEQYGLTLFLVQAMGLMFLVVSTATLVLLFLSRAIGRRAEFAIRSVYGATPGKLAFQSAREALGLAICGALTAILFCFSALALARRFAPNLALIDAPGVSHWPVLALALLAGLGSCLLAAIFPQVLGIRGQYEDLSKEATDHRGPDRWLNAVVAAQAALTIFLGSSGYQMLLQFQEAMSFDPGFVVERLIVADAPEIQQGEHQDHEANQRQLVRSLLAVQGIEKIAFSDSFPLLAAARSTVEIAFVRQDQSSFEAPRQALVAIVSPGYFQTLGIPLLIGRDFEDTDIRASSGVIINQSLATELGGVDSALQAKIRVEGLLTPQRVLAVVQNVRSPYDAATRLHIYRPSAAWRYVIVRTAVNPRSLLGVFQEGLIQSRVAHEPAVLAAGNSMLDDLTTEPRLRFQLIAFFAVVSLLLSAGGIYSLVSYRLRRSRRDNAVRTMLGARRWHITWDAVRQMGWPGVIGFGGGVLACLVVTKSAEQFSNHIGEVNALPLLASAFTMVLAGSLATTLAVRRVLGFEPARWLSKG